MRNLLLFFPVCLCFFGKTSGQTIVHFDSVFLAHLASGDWNYVYFSLAPVVNGHSKGPASQEKPGSSFGIASSGTDAVSRYLLGHAALLTPSHNNTATHMFYHAYDSIHSKPLDDWLAFAKWFHAIFRASPVSFYLLGDAYARQGDLQGAKLQMDSALSYNPNDAAVLNSFGVVLWLLYENSGMQRLVFRDAALSALGKALDINPNLADVYANRAIFNIRNSGDMQLPRLDLLEAVRLDSSFYLAVNTMAFTYGEEGFKSAYDDYEQKIFASDSSTPFNRRSPFDTAISLSTVNGNIKISADFKPGGIGIGAEFTLRDAYDVLSGNLSSLGGVYGCLYEGNNLVTIGSKPLIMGTWFNLNYPNKNITIKKEE